MHLWVNTYILIPLRHFLVNFFWGGISKYSPNSNLTYIKLYSFYCINRVFLEVLFAIRNIYSYFQRLSTWYLVIFLTKVVLVYVINRTSVYVMTYISVIITVRLVGKFNLIIVQTNAETRIILYFVMIYTSHSV